MEVNQDVNGTAHPRLPMPAPRLRDAGLRPLLALCLLGIGQGLQIIGLPLLGPSISASLGIGMGRGPQFFTFQHDLLSVGAICAAIATGAVVYRLRRPHRNRLVRGLALLWAAVLVLVAVVITANGMLIGSLLLAGGVAGAMQALQWPLLFDSYPASLRLRAFRVHTGVSALSSSAACLGIYLTLFHSTWSWSGALLIMAIGIFLCSVGAPTFRDPASRSSDHPHSGEENGGPNFGAPAVETGPDGTINSSDPSSGVGFFETLRQVIVVPSVRPALTLFLIFGLVTVSMVAYAGYYSEDRWGLARGGEAGLLAVLFLAPVLCLCLLALWRAQAGAADLPGCLRRAAAAEILGSVAAGAAVLVPSRGAMIACLAVAFAGIYLVVPGACVVLFSVVRPSHRNPAGALAATAVAVGALVGPSLTGAFYTRFGTRWALIVLDFACLVLAGGVYRRAHLVGADTANVEERIAEETRRRALLGSARRFPLLSCSQIDFSYGSLQVLFGVELSVEDGEMVALLGTNGAGKSTLLRVICGLGYPSRGSVQFDGNDISYVSSGRRVALGISQVPGGRAVFGPMTVVDNLRAFAYSLGRQRGTIDRRIEIVFQTFPILAERRNQHASTLSGGEQQMLALGKAILLRPKLLAIDELSLGLAPIVTGQLLEMVRQINAAGTSIILVEQSVNIALSLVDHAYFMEKGEMRFDGSASDLIGRDDILRAVFLPHATEQ